MSITSRRMLLGSAFVLPVILAACASLSLNNVDFGWPVEASVVIGQANTVEEGRYAIAFNVAPLAIEEFQDSSALKGKTLRVLRNTTGFYFVTGEGFRNVYVLSPGEGKLTLKKRIGMGKDPDGQPIRLNDPALNQRLPYVELVDGSTKILLSPDGPVESGGSK